MNIIKRVIGNVFNVLVRYVEINQPPFKHIVTVNPNYAHVINEWGKFRNENINFYKPIYFDLSDTNIYNEHFTIEKINNITHLLLLGRREQKLVIIKVNTIRDLYNLKKIKTLDSGYDNALALLLDTIFENSIRIQ